MLRIVGRLPSRNFQTKTRRVLQLKLYKSVRFYAKDICPPPPPRKETSGSGAIYTLGALALVGGATIGYAKYDPDFRKTLTEYVPFTDDIIKFVFQEEGTILGSISHKYEDAKKSVGDLMTSTQDKIIQHDQKPYKAPQPVIPALEDTKVKQEAYTEIRIDQKDKEVEIAGEVKIPPAEQKVSEVHPSNLAELEEKICIAATDAVNAYNQAIYDLRVYNRDISSIIEESVDRIEPPKWEAIRQRTKDKNESLGLAENKAKEAASTVTKLQALFKRCEKEASPATREMVNINITKVQEDIQAAKSQYEIEKKLGSITERYWEKVQKARHHFCEELESLFPTIDIYNKKLEVNESDLDLFVLHAYNVVLYYQKELARLETITHSKLEAAVESARRGGGETLNNAQICEAVDAEKRRLTLCFQKQCMKLRQEAEHDLREQLKRQSQVFTDHLDEVVKTRTLEIERNLTRRYDEELESEKMKYKTQLAAMVGRMKGLDHALKVSGIEEARDAADKAAKQSQVLWAACQALLRAIKTGCPGIAWKDQLRPLNPEITLVQKAAAKGDELVEAVINGIPKEAVERGVFPEDALRERFLKVETVARRVALVPEQGGALPLHILSYIQAFFLIKNPSPIPQAELNDEAVDFSQLSTNEILQRARYWLDRGDFAQTLKYMNLLQGAPRSIARQWMNETRILLETQQAANVLMAHAASSGLLHL